jgi:hypothetical protein
VFLTPTTFQAHSVQSETSHRTEEELDKEADNQILTLLPEKLGPPMLNDELIDFIIDPPPIKTPEDENRLIVQIINSFNTAPDGGWVRQLFSLSRFLCSIY